MSIKSFLSPERMRKLFRIISLTFLVFSFFFLVLGTVAYLKREAVLNFALKKSVRKLYKDYALKVHMGSVKLEGIKSIHIKDISIVPDHRDSLFVAKDLKISISLLPLFFGHIDISELQMKDSRLSLVNRKGIRNFDFLFKKKGDKKGTKERNLSKMAEHLVEKMLDKVPEDMLVKNFRASYCNDTDSLVFLVPKASIDGGDLKSTIITNGGTATWHLNGDVEPSEQHLQFMLTAEKGKIELPFLEERWKMKFNCDTLNMELKDSERSGGVYRLYGYWEVSNLLLNHQKLSPKDIVFPRLCAETNIFVGKNYFSLDSSSVLRLGDAEMNPFVKYTLSPKKKYELGLNIPQAEAQKLFDAIPNGIFQTLEGIQVSGNLGYNFLLAFDTAYPDSVFLRSAVSPDRFKIEQYGASVLNKMNAPFYYTPYEKDKEVRTIFIGEDNPDYTPLTSVSPLLKYALLTAEDYTFFSHHGFNEEAFRKSIVTNIKAKAYKRGASTISMQLVKNVFLNRQKTLFRKLEEIILVWLIEEQRITSKNRMFEVYVNIIEWGPNVYGIGEAARYYFGKRPSELTIGECIFLASIVPKPKKALYSFEPSGSLKSYLRGYYSLIGGLMARRGYTPRDTSYYGYYNLKIRRDLLRQIHPQTSISDEVDEEPSETYDYAEEEDLYMQRNQDSYYDE